MSERLETKPQNHTYDEPTSNESSVRDQMSMDYTVMDLGSSLSQPETPTKQTTGPDAARRELDAKYSSRFQERLNFGSLCTYVPNKKLPIFRWFKYKEGFSRALVERILVDEWGLPPGSVIFDPFAGSGTTLLASQQLGYRAFGTEIMPISVFVSRAKLQLTYSYHELCEAVERLFDKVYLPANRRLPPVRIVTLGLSEEVQDRLVFFRDAIQEMNCIPDESRAFLMLGLLSIIEDVSKTSKDGQFLRLVERQIPPVETALAVRYNEMLADLHVAESLFRENCQVFPATIIQADARDLPYGPETENTVDAIVTSPPYLNRYDYSRTYSLELLLLFANDFAALKEIRHSLLRSHIESRPAPTNDVRIPALDEILSNIAPKRLNNPRIPTMIRGYFEDMNRAIREMHRLTRPGGRVALVVANARFEGELTPVDLILSELAEEAGFHTESIWITRYKGNSSQQMGRYGRVPVRESIVFWKKR